MTQESKSKLPDNPTGINLASAWYIALSSRRLKPGKVLALELFGEKLVAWRTKSGRPVIMPRYCPHQGASLAIGKVIDDELRCPFHHWRFDGAGVCTAIPGAKRIPPTARVSPYPVVERYGYVWVWYGTAAPLYDVPDFPPLTTEKGSFRTYTFKYTTPAHPLRVLENAFDATHFRVVHSLPTNGHLQVQRLTEPNDSSENGKPIAACAWFGIRLHAGTLNFPTPFKRLGSRLKFSLLVDGWPGGQRLSFELNGVAKAKEFFSIKPVRPGLTIFRGIGAVIKTQGMLGSYPVFAGYRFQHKVGTHEDLRIYETAVQTDGSVNEPDDASVLRFRQYYNRWKKDGWS
mgnify:FL=1